MVQVLKSAVLWQVLGGFALGTALVVMTAPADGVHAAMRSLGLLG